MPDGEVTQPRLENDPTRLEQFLADLPRGTRIAIEASGTWGWFVDLVERLGHHAVLSNPKQTKAIAAARLKKDRGDAERLALRLRGDLLPTVWIPPAPLREARKLVRHRVSLVWVRTEIKTRLLALRSRRHLQPTSSQRWLPVRGRRELAELPLDAIPSTGRADGLALLRVLDEQIRRLDHELVNRCSDDPRVPRLRTISVI